MTTLLGQITALTAPRGASCRARGVLSTLVRYSSRRSRSVEQWRLASGSGYTVVVILVMLRQCEHTEYMAQELGPMKAAMRV